MPGVPDDYGGSYDVPRLWKLGLLLAALAPVPLTAGCSGGSTATMDEVKINGMSPGQYRDANEDAPARGKARGARAGSRTKPR
jgi:hypothetical protein